MKSGSPPKTPDDLAAIKEALSILQDFLSDRVDWDEIGTFSKTPYKAFVVREGLLWRAVELAKGAISEIKTENWLSAVILARSLMEVSAVQGELARIFKEVGNEIPISEVDDRVMQLLMGSRLPTRSVDSLNILTMIDRVDNNFSGFRTDYDYLSEYAHPNWQSTIGLFSAREDDTKQTAFSLYADGLDTLRNEVLTSLKHALVHNSFFLCEQLENCEHFFSSCNQYAEKLAAQENC